MSDDRERSATANPLFGDWDDELLAEELGRALTHDPEHPLWRDERFLDWLAIEARERARRGRSSADRLSDAAFRARGEALMARAYARQLHVAVHGHRPPECARPTIVAGGIPVIEMGIAAGVGRELWDEPVEAWVEAPTDAPAGEYLALKIVGESMAPLMHTGDTVLIRMGIDVARETIIVARHPENGYVCKRVSLVRRDVIELASLEPGRAPMIIPRDAALILGTVILVWCHHRQ
jgi:phage repressor protein C with HTH and peptisase S24 domain